MSAYSCGRCSSTTTRGTMRGTASYYTCTHLLWNVLKKVTLLLIYLPSYRWQEALMLWAASYRLWCVMILMIWYGSNGPHLP